MPRKRATKPHQLNKNSLAESSRPAIATSSTDKNICISLEQKRNELKNRTFQHLNPKQHSYQPICLRQIEFVSQEIRSCALVSNALPDFAKTNHQLQPIIIHSLDRPTDQKILAISISYLLSTSSGFKAATCPLPGLAQSSSKPNR